ncbi:hypothetical protein L211DRAFT_847989 [Terfezia boudieri ATCC MYA-4762]|uniref:NUC153 domain-containing protein n=1 Tax=Terfezia boudieri ATCC MYA-4762 TaxID=1051890 RepID=A0A3N4LS15_9PEZI|nr:hypothetical protein L211DRAFT_847989 [Terfezia boudieri ATCC MYA-4762]
MKEVVEAEEEKKFRRGRKRIRQRMPKASRVGSRLMSKIYRFAALFEEHEFAIDPTNPRFKQTTTMKKKNQADNSENGPNRKKWKAEMQAGDDVSRLVQSLKRKSKSK